MIENIFTEIGISEREQAVYKSLLSLGSTTTGQLSRDSGVSNAKIYEILEKLIKKGLVSFIYKGKIKYFQASSPSKLMNYLDEKRISLSKAIKELEKKNNKYEYQATVYEGVRSIKYLFLEMYEYIGENSTYCVFPLGEELSTPEMIKFWDEVFNKRIALKIKIKVLPHTSLKETIEKNYLKYPGIKIKYTSYKFPTGIFIFKDHILNILWKDNPVAFLIKSKENYEKWQKFFDEQWRL